MIPSNIHKSILVLTSYKTHQWKVALTKFRRKEGLGSPKIGCVTLGVVKTLLLVVEKLPLLVIPSKPIFGL